MSYGWIIDVDHYPEGKPGTNANAVGLCGPRGISREEELLLLSGEGHKFRMLDGDGNLYYEGRLVGDHESEDGFGPLDDFGSPNAGATSIEYWYPNRNRWEML